MRAAVYNPYWDSLGGGERYTISFAKVLSENGYDVDIEWKEPTILHSIKERFAIESEKFNVIGDIKRGDKYEVCFWVSDGSIPLLRSRKNFLHFQFPFKNVSGNSLFNRTKMFRVKKVIVNSRFTKSFIDKEYGVESKVVYPPVDVESLKPGKKENLILYVGRFSQLTQKKNQHILIKAFKKLNEGKFKDWKLILAGGVGVGTSENYLEELKKSALNYNVEFIENPSYKELLALYKKAKVFWSASGYGVDELENPTQVEHFGITLVEAMAAGCVVLVSNAGGHKEIVKSGNNGYLWNDIDELISLTQKVIGDKKLLLGMSKEAIGNSSNYSYEIFKKEVEALI